MLVDMNTKVPTQIGMREFMRNTKKIKAAVAKGQEFEVLEHTKPVFRVVPTKDTANTTGKYQFMDLAQFQFEGGDGDLAERIDEIVYGS